MRFLFVVEFLESAIETAYKTPGDYLHDGWEHEIARKVFNKNGTLKNHPRWKIIQLFRKYNVTTLKQWNQVVTFFDNYMTNIDYNSPIDGFKWPTELIPEIESYYDYLDYMNEVANQQQEADEAMEEDFNKAAEEAYKEQGVWKVEDLYHEPATKVVEEQEQVEEDFDKEQELEYCNTLKDKSVYEKGVKFYIGKNKRVRFSVLKPYVLNFLNSITDLNKWCFRYYIEAFGKGEWKTIPLNSDNIPRIKQFIDNQSYGSIRNMIEDYFQEAGQEVRYINVSDQLEMINDAPLTIDMCSAIEITPKSFGNKKSEIEIYCDNGGAFYDSIIKEDYSYLERFTSRYQIFSNLLNENNKPREEYDYNCLLYAFKQSGQLDDKTLAAMKVRCFTRIVSYKQVCELCKDFKIRLTIKKYDSKQKQMKSINSDKYIGYKGDDAIATINLVLLRKHYFLNETVEGITSYYIKNIDSVNAWCIEHNKPLEYGFKITRFNKKGNPDIDIRRAHISSHELISLMEEHNIVRKLTFTDRAIFQSDLHHYIKSDIDSLLVHENDCRKVELKDKKEHEQPRVFYADCESDVVTNNVHKAIYIAWTERNSNVIHGAHGEDCLDQFFNAIPNKSIVYFHNLGYDSRLMSSFNITQAIDKNSRVMSEDIKYNGKTIKLKDSYSILSMKLARFPKTFGLECGAKEMFPYRYYTIERMKTNCGIISEAGTDEIPQNWNQQQFEDNLKKIGADNGNGTFDMLKYVEFYCKQDVRILQQGFDKFRYDTLNGPIAMDVDDFLTAPAIANAYFKQHIYSQAEDMYEYSGITREFIQQCVYGGRCMTRDNLKWYVTKTLNDFDAVSLYPSAMKRLYVVNGTPKVMTKDMLNTAYLLSHTAGEQEQVSSSKPISAYCVHINITKVGINRHFPLIVKKDPITKTNRNVNECCEMYVDNIMLEDLIKYQGIECEIISGLYWTGKKDFTMQDVIQKLHELRCEYKVTKNPMQEIIKLIMNSAYGKTIQKPIKSTTVYKKVQTFETKYRSYKNKVETNKSKQFFEEHKDRIRVDAEGREYIRLQATPAQSYIEKNHAKIKEAYDINTNLVGIVTNKQIDDFFTPTLMGVQILSMSKRLMNEVMCTAEDNDIPIYYQDTDSMHIENDLIPLLADKFRERFGRELIGKNLGQFHNDFDELDHNPVSIESYFLGKKAYIDKLTNDNNEIAYHIRMKGVTGSCIELEAERQFNGEVMSLYKHLADNKHLKFNLTDVAPKFKSNKNRTVCNITDFKRTIKFIGELNIV